MGIKNIIYKKNDICLSIHLNDENIISYKDISQVISNELVFKYLASLFRIIDGWQEEYIDKTLIDGDNWKLSINYINGNKKEYHGKASYPLNFEAFERLNQSLINGV